MIIVLSGVEHARSEAESITVEGITVGSIWEGGSKPSLTNYSNQELMETLHHLVEQLREDLVRLIDLWSSSQSSVNEVNSWGERGLIEL